MKITINGTLREVEASATLYQLAEAERPEIPTALAVVNGKLRELFHGVREGDEIKFLPITDKSGYDALRRSLSMLFLAAVNDCYGQEAGNIVLHFAEGSGFWFTLSGFSGIGEDFISRVSSRMREMAAASLRFEKRSVPTADARELFRKLGMPDKEKLFRTRLSSSVNVYRLGNYEDYYYGFMLYDTSLLTKFKLIPLHGGVVVQMPDRENPDLIPKFSSSSKLFYAKTEGEQWAETLRIGTVADLNERIIEGDSSQLILISEALQEAKISDFAEMIVERGGVRFVMIAGPSSSGKTTFSQRLSIQLAAHGLVPHYIGTDNYFINREDMKPGPDGQLDFEGLSAVDVEKFNLDMMDLLEGKTIELPTFDFVTGKRIMSGEKLTMGKNDVLVIEGLHCLNDDLSYRLPRESKFKIYISALTQLNIDEHNRVPSGDGRLLRRIVRDSRTRGYSASQTISQWNTVRKGEAANIFPYQESADIVFTTSLPYELAALKTFAEPLLFQVEQDDPSWFEARRLLKFLDYFIAVPPTGIPANSILREFIGNGCFRL